MNLPDICEECKGKFDFGKHASGYCSNCKKWFCIDCAYAHSPKDHSARMCIISNPQWILNLVNSIERDQKGH